MHNRCDRIVFQGDRSKDENQEFAACESALTPVALLDGLSWKLRSPARSLAIRTRGTHRDANAF